jgi:hypothetical protein
MVCSSVSNQVFVVVNGIAKKVVGRRILGDQVEIVDGLAEGDS